MKHYRVKPDTRVSLHDEGARDTGDYRREEEAAGRTEQLRQKLDALQVCCGPSDVYKLYAESFSDRPHLEHIQTEAQALVTRLFAQASIPPTPRGTR